MISNIKSCFPHTWKVFILAMRAGTKNEEIVKNVQSTNKHSLENKHKHKNTNVRLSLTPV